MSFWHQLRQLIVNKDVTSTNSVPHIRAPQASVLTTRQQLFVLVAVSVCLYVLAPSLPILFTKKPPMFSKRPDKYTTGLINLRNDCFANSSLQAYLSLPGLTDYLNKFVVTFNHLVKEIYNAEIDAAELVPRQKQPKSKFNNTKIAIPLHLALADIVKKLQETQLSSRTISVWLFLHALENIFNAKISRSQHDAQELTQLINETLENENIHIAKILSALKRKATGVAKVDSLEVPEFPFSGLVLSQMKCLACNYVSKPSFSPFLMLTLHTPEKISTDLDTILDENESESIEGYQCLKCRLEAILRHEAILKEQGKALAEEEEKIILTLANLNSGQLCINEDLEPELEEYVKAYSKGGLNISDITSTVLRKNQVLKPPKIFGLHLSRSSFNGVDITRNSCNVKFKDQLTLSIGKEYHEELRQFKAAAAQDELVYEKNIESKILTTDVEDMEDEEVQREDIDEKGEEDPDEEDPTTGESTTEGEEDSVIEEEEEEDEEVDDNSSQTSVESVLQSLATTMTLKENVVQPPVLGPSDSLSNTTTLRVPETLNNAPISETQTVNLKSHFRRFKFNDNNTYKYKLKAIIKHQGSHTQGHYECFKRKPLYVKDREGQIFKLSPEIYDDLTGETTCDIAPVNDADVPNENVPVESTPQAAEETSSGAETRRRKFSLSLNSNSDSLKRNASVSSHKPDDDYKGKGRTGSNSSYTSDEPRLASVERENSLGLRRKFSLMMGRRPSVVQADPAQANIQEIIHSGILTPAELLVDGLDTNYFSSALAIAALEKSEAERRKNEPKNKVKMKKIPSLIKYPYWRISDSTTSEVTSSAVLSETSSVYMLYYERVDRKQVRRRD